MNLVDASSKNPLAVVVVVVLIGVFGWISMRQLPLQLFPDIDRPQISVETGWRAASPEEVESELLEPQERVLQGLAGVEEMQGVAGGGRSAVTLTYAIGTDMKAALVEVIGRLNRLPPLPRDADRPVVQLGFDQNQVLTWFFVQLLPGTAGTALDHRRFVENTVQARLEAIPGVGGVEVRAGEPEQLQITVDLARAAALGIPITEIAARAASATDVSGGRVEVGRREYTLRFAGRYAPDALGELVLAWRDGRPVRLGDVATIAVQPPDARFFQYQNGNPAIGVQVRRQSGANVLATLDEVKRVVAELREGPLAARGLGIEQSHDSGLFIRRAIGLLTESLVVGALLALLCVWAFMRDLRATVLIAAAIPICVLATFIVLGAAGRTLNVISLAGLAFAVGMVVECAIVVSGNILRLKEDGFAAAEAALRGTTQVVPALFASTVTTIAVFVPVMFLEDIEGQLFADLALTISIAVGVSLLVAITVLPALAGRWLGGRPARSGYGAGWPALTDRVMAWTATRPRQIAWVVALLFVPLALCWMFMPPLDYLPPVKRAAIDANLSFPIDMTPALADREIAPVLMQRMRPYMDGDREPRLRNWYLQLWPGGGSLAARAVDPAALPELERLIREEIVVGLPDAQSFVREGDLFGGLGGGTARSIALHLQSEDGKALERVAADARTLLESTFPGAIVQTVPRADAVQPELRALPDDRRIAEAGWDRAALATVVRTLGSGAWLGEHFTGQTRVPIILRAGPMQGPEALAEAPLATPGGQIVPFGELVDLRTLFGPSEIRRLDKRRTVTVLLDPPASTALEDVLATLQDRIVPALAARLPADGTIRLAGSADRLETIIATMAANFALALFVLLAIMAALFKSLKDALIVLLTVPLALIGGLSGLRVLGVFAFQPLDLLSMIGFIMMIGVVVNHSILLVDLTREAQRHGHSLDEAIAMSLNQRLRAILASTLTGALGALPMAVNPGPGSVIYRGLAAVTVGGVVVSLVFSILLLPSLLRLFGRAGAVPAAPRLRVALARAA